ncbi:MAG: Tad domain-containing protein [Pseudomonadota bacterium]
MMRDFQRNEEGAVTFFVLILSIGLLALSGLVMDSGRTFSAHSQSQAYLDHIALAIANELDGQSDAITRAEAVFKAASSVDGEDAVSFEGTINKSSTLISSLIGDPAEQFSVKSVMFLKDQPNTKGSVLTGSALVALETNKADEATHVLVIGETESVPWTFLNMTSLVAGLGGETTATAGEVASEAAGGGDFTVATWSTAELVTDSTRTNEFFAVCAPSNWDSIVPGQELVFDKSRNGIWNEGNYGIITDLADDEDGTCDAFARDGDGNFDANKYLVCAATLADPERSIHDTSVSFVSDVANAQGEEQFTLFAGLNTRFGILEGEAAALADEALPDENILYKDVFQCNGELDFGTITNIGGLPQSDCIQDGSCTVGNQLTAEEVRQYMLRTHGNEANWPLYNGVLPTTRNEIYLAEILAGQTNPDGTQSPLTCWETLNEDGTTAVSANAPTPVANRRNLEIAFVDCSSFNDAGAINALTDIPVLAYADIFLTRPVENDSLTVLNFEDFADPTKVDANGAPLLDPNGDPYIIQINSGDVVSTDERFTGEATDPSDSDAWLWNVAGAEAQGVADVSSIRYDRTFNPYAVYGIQIDAYRHEDAFSDPDGSSAWKSSPMIYGEVGGADSDLENIGWGNVLMISEDGDDSDPDDEARGGTLVVRFLPDPVNEECAYVETLRVIDTEGGGTVRVFNTVLSDEDIASLPAYNSDYSAGEPHHPEPVEGASPGPGETHSLDLETGILSAWKSDTGAEITPDPEFMMGSFMTVTAAVVGEGGDNYTTQVDIQRDDVCTLLYTMHGDSGGIDDIEFSRNNAPDQSDTIFAEFLNYIEAGDGRVLTYPQITN